MQKSLTSVFVVLFLFFVFLPAHAQEERGDAFFDLGVFAYESEDYQTAEKNFLKALELAPENPFYIHFLGRTYLKMERFEDAERQFAKVWKLNPDMPGLKYDTAYLYYKMSDHAKAAELFTQVAKEEPSNVLAVYHAGMNCFKLSRYQTALDYFLAASEKSPSIKANGYYYAGICFQKTGQIEKAVEKFIYVKDHADSGLLKDNAVKWLKTIESQQAALKPLSLYLQISRQYDDNVRLEPLDQDLYADEDDWSVVAAFLGRYDVVHRPDYTIGVGYNHYQTWHDTLSAFDLIGSTGNFYAKYRLDAITLGFSYLPTYYWLDDKSYLMRHQLKPAVLWEVADNLSARFSYSYYRNNYFNNNDRDGHTHEGLLDAYYTFVHRKILLFAGIGYEDNSASHPDQYYGQLKTRLGLSVELPWELNLGLTVKYYNKEYDNVDSSFGVTRKDDKYYGSISLSRRFLWEWLSIVFEYNHTKNESNIDKFDYKRNITSLSLTARY